MLLVSLAPAITKNLGSKAVALLLALVVCAYVYTEEEQRTRLRIPLHVNGLAPDLVLVGDPPDEVAVTARGKGRHLFKLRFRPPHMELDLSEARRGEVQRMLSPADVFLPVDMDVSIVEIAAPRMVTLAVDTLIQKNVPVEVPLMGELPAEFAWLGPVRAEPPEVLVRGPSGAVGDIDRVVTEPVNLSVVRDSSALIRAVRWGQPRGSVTPESVRLIVPVAAVRRRSLGPLPVGVTGLGRSLAAAARPDSAVVLLEGPVGVVDSVTARDVAVAVDLSGLEPGVYQLAPRAALIHELVTVSAILPNRVTEEVVRAPR